MADFVEREKVLAEYDRQHKGPPGGARKIIETFPAADVRHVVRGEWVQVMGKYDWMVKCSRCNGVPLETSNFCPNCGADMREVTINGN